MIELRQWCSRMKNAAIQGSNRIVCNTLNWIENWIEKQILISAAIFQIFSNDLITLSNVFQILSILFQIGKLSKDFHVLSNDFKCLSNERL